MYRPCEPTESGFMESSHTWITVPQSGDGVVEGAAEMSLVPDVLSVSRRRRRRRLFVVGSAAMVSDHGWHAAAAAAAATHSPLGAMRPCTKERWDGSGCGSGDGSGSMSAVALSSLSGASISSIDIPGRDFTVGCFGTTAN